MPRKASPKKQPNKIKTRDGRIVRKLQRPEYKTFRLTKRITHPGPRLPSGFQLARKAVRHIWNHKKYFLGITSLYLLLTLLLVRGVVVLSDLTETKAALTELFTGSFNQLAASVAVFGLLASSAAPTDTTASLYQSILVTIFSLFIIWTLRQTYAKETISFKDIFYRSSYPLVQFILVVILIGIQLIPLLLGAFLYNQTIASGLSTTALEVLSWVALIFLLVLWSFYMLTVSLFAIYIVTLPEMRPIQALKSAKKLVQFRRWTVLRKLLFLPFAIVLSGLVIMIPVILMATGIAETVFLILSSFILVIVHSYIYTLYRELLNE